MIDHGGHNACGYIDFYLFIDFCIRIDAEDVEITHYQIILMRFELLGGRVVDKSRDTDGREIDIDQVQEIGRKSQHDDIAFAFSTMKPDYRAMGYHDHGILGHHMTLHIDLYVDSPFFDERHDHAVVFIWCHAGRAVYTEIVDVGIGIIPP